MHYIFHSGLLIILSTVNIYRMHRISILSSCVSDLPLYHPLSYLFSMIKVCTSCFDISGWNLESNTPCHIIMTMLPMDVRQCILEFLSNDILPHLQWFSTHQRESMSLLVQAFQGCLDDLRYAGSLCYFWAPWNPPITLSYLPKSTNIILDIANNPIAYHK